MLDRCQPDDLDREILQTMAQSSERAAQLTRQLLAYAGRGRFTQVPVNLSGLVSENTDLIRTSIPKKVQLELDLEPDLPLIKADPAQMQQLAMNLIINAGEAIGEAEGTVSVATRVDELDPSRASEFPMVGEVTENEYVRLEVSDDGCGMEKETAGKIFDPFFTTKFPGRGLGLAAVWGIVTGHKGALHVESSPGLGSRFRVWLPAAQELARSRAERQGVRRGPHHRGTILVVDDEPPVRKLAECMLRQCGYAVVVAEDGRQAVELFRKRSAQISLVLLDLTMPAMNGEEVLQHLKAIRADVPVILSSGYGETEVVQRLASEGLVGFLQKPYKSGELTEMIAGALAPPS